MSALVNLTSSLSTFNSSLLASMPPPPPPIYSFPPPTWNQANSSLVSGTKLDAYDSPFSGFESFPSDFGSAPRHKKRHHREKMLAQRRQRQRNADSESEKKRRSLNVQTSYKTRIGQLQTTSGTKTNSVSVVEVQRNGLVRTAHYTQSPQSELMILFWCHIAPLLFKPCKELASSELGPILLYFEKSNRYLCMNHTGEIFTRVRGLEPSYEDEDCIFYHEYFQMNDFFYSWKYPHSKSRCRQTTTDITNRTTSRTCTNHWYLGVSRHGQMRTVKTSPQKRRVHTRFILTWNNDNPKPPTAIPPELLTGIFPEPTLPDPDAKRVKSTDSWSKKKSKPVFGILAHKDVPERRLGGTKGYRDQRDPFWSSSAAPDTESVKSRACKNLDSSNLLSSSDESRRGGCAKRRLGAGDDVLLGSSSSSSSSSVRDLRKRRPPHPPSQSRDKQPEHDVDNSPFRNRNG